MTLSSTQLQLTDYLTQIRNLSCQKPLPQITHTTIAKLLSVSPTCISYLLKKERNSPKPLKNFILKYPTEFAKWPKEESTIKRILSISDALYFLGIPEKIALPKLLPLKEKVQPKINVKNKSVSIANTANEPLLLPPNIVKVKPMMSLKLHETKVVKQPKFRKVQRFTAPLAISYRGHQSIKDGQGMLFDHMRLQDLTKIPTCTLVPENTNIANDATKYFKKALKEHSAALLFGEKDENLITYPSNVQECANLGLLIIPGRVRAIEDEPIRLAHEYKIIRGALNRGQPILGICAGSWRLFEQLFSWTKSPETMAKPSDALSKWHIVNRTLIDVQDHCYNSGMIRLGNNGVKAVNNVQIHDIIIKEGSLLSVSMSMSSGNAPKIQTVNSVHWKAVNKDKMPENVEISAEARKCPSIAIKTRQGSKMMPQEETAEAFENMHGAPLLGIQWHPEGYDINMPHAKLIQYMALAGNAYAAKRLVLKELDDRKFKDLYGTCSSKQNFKR